VLRLRIRLKGCPRCRGDLFPEYDLTGSDLVCLQCGYVQTVSIIEPEEEQPGPVVVEARHNLGVVAA
jgi:hypothetical protein